MSDSKVNETGPSKHASSSPLDSKSKSFGRMAALTQERTSTRWQLFLPLIFVITFWAITSTATNVYLVDSDREYQDLLQANIASLHAANAIQLTAWQLMARGIQGDVHAISVSDEVKYLGKIDVAVRELEQMPHQTCDPRIIEKIRSEANTLAAYLRRTRDVATKPMVNADELEEALLSKVNPLIQTAEVVVASQRDYLKLWMESRQRTQNRLLLIRLLSLLLGPLLGVYLGVRASSLLHRRFAVLAVTLRQGTVSNEVELEQVTVSEKADIGQVQNLAEAIRDRVNRLDQELRSARQAIIRSERLAAVGELSAGVAHEIRNPLTSVKLLLQDAARKSREISLNQTKTELILSEIQRMENVIEGLLNYSRPKDLQATLLDFCIPVARAINLVHGRMAQSQVTLDLSMPKTPIWVEGDNDLLHQVVVNLLLNAIEAMPQGGSLSLRVTEKPEYEQVELAICDSGPGIEARMLGQLFEPFATTKEKGRGWGWH